MSRLHCPTCGMPTIEDRPGLTDLDAAACNLCQENQELLQAYAPTEPPTLLDALKALTEWGCTHTSPRDANSPHALLIDARAAIARAEGRA